MVKQETVYEVWFSCNMSVLMTAWGNDKDKLIEEAEKIKRNLRHTDVEIADVDFRDMEEW